MIPAYRRYSYRGWQAKEALFADLAWRIASGMPKLEHVEISEKAQRWSFSVTMDGQGEVQIVKDDLNG